MPRQVQRDRETYMIEWDDELGAVVHTWEEYTSGQAFRDGCEELLDVIEERNASKMLVDTSGIRAHDEEDKAWLQQEWVPRAVDAGMDYAVTVVPDSVISKKDMEELLEQLEDLPYEAYMTADMDDAREWLAEKS